MNPAKPHPKPDNPAASGTTPSRRHLIVGDDGLSLDTISIKNLPEGSVIGYFDTRDKVKRMLWYIVQATLFRYSFRRADQWRSFLLRKFGAKIGNVDLIRNTVRIEVPWNLEIGDGVQIGDAVYLYALGPIKIGDRSIISQFVHLCAGTHDFERTDFPLLRIPIVIGSDCWIATETYIAPGVTIGNGTVVGARAVVVKDLPEWTVCVGSPARPIKPRKLVDIESGTIFSPSPQSSSGENT